MYSMNLYLADVQIYFLSRAGIEVEEELLLQNGLWHLLNVLNVSKHLKLIITKYKSLFGKELSNN